MGKLDLKLYGKKKKNNNNKVTMFDTTRRFYLLDMCQARRSTPRGKVCGRKDEKDPNDLVELTKLKHHPKQKHKIKIGKQSPFPPPGTFSLF